MRVTTAPHKARSDHTCTDPGSWGAHTICHSPRLLSRAPGRPREFTRAVHAYILEHCLFWAVPSLSSLGLFVVRQILGWDCLFSHYLTCRLTVSRARAYLTTAALCQHKGRRKCPRGKVKHHGCRTNCQGHLHQNQPRRWGGSSRASVGPEPQSQNPCKVSTVARVSTPVLTERRAR